MINGLEKKESERFYPCPKQARKPKQSGRPYESGNSKEHARVEGGSTARGDNDKGEHTERCRLGML